MPFFHSSLRFSLYLLVLFFSSCGGDKDERPEIVDRVRGVGFKLDSPIISFPDSNPQSIGFTLYAALPSGQSLSSVTSFSDELGGPTAASSVVQLTFNDDGSYEDLGSMQLYSQTGNVQVPFIPDTLIDDFGGVFHAHIGVTLSNSSRTERMVSDLLVVKAGDESLSWTTPTMAWVNPTGSSIGTQEVPIEFSITSTTDEKIKVAWFASSGEVKNMRSKKTTWSEIGAGEAGIVAAIYPSRSKGFQLLSKKLTAK